MSRIIALILFFSVTLMYSCSTDFEVNDEWKDITVVYCLLDQTDTAQYVKVNKAFLGDMDAYEMAQNSDSLFYDDVQVTLEELNNGSSTNLFLLEPTDEIQKEDGIFASDKNILYKTTEPLNISRQYTLSIFFPATDKKVTSDTINLISGLTPVLPLKIDFANTKYPLTLKWDTCANGKIYDLTIKFKYYEVDKINYDTTEYFIEWPQSSVVSGSTQTMEINIDKAAFFQLLKSRIPFKEGIKRIVKEGALDFIFTVGGDDLYTYVQVNKPSYGLIQEKPSFTNINNGIGLFSCRYKKVIYDKPVSANTLDSIANGQYTKDLLFEIYTEL